MRKIVLLIISSSIMGCGTDWPVRQPQVWQCQFNYSKTVDPAWFCVNTETREREKRELLDPRMKGAQALSPDDFKVAEKWGKDLRAWISEYCK